MSDGRGFTLIETLMVIVLMGIMGTGLVYYFAALGSSTQSQAVQASALGQERLERIIADKKASGFNSIIPEAPMTLPAPYDRFTRSVEVICVNETDLDLSAGTMPECADTDISAKRVKVTVSWQGGSADFTTIITDH
jgi:prepilin-type N-terminal cleavage/methylation domain-containing protein